ncbi:MAG: hypothetical protein R3351_08910, partial [Nitrospirales bacterium]|nr:hypothetical protein [Nitrospirales bacterium]
SSRPPHGVVYPLHNSRSGFRISSRMLKKSASGVLGSLSCSRTPVYAPRAKGPAALLDLASHRRAELFEHPVWLLGLIALENWSG